MTHEAKARPFQIADSLAFKLLAKFYHRYYSGTRRQHKRSLDHADEFMAGNAGKSHIPFGDFQIGAADAGQEDADPALVRKAGGKEIFLNVSDFLKARACIDQR